MQRRPGTGGSQAVAPGRAAATSRLPPIEGPLRPGERQVSGDVEVEQLSAERAVLRRGDDVITIEGSRHRNEGYAFHIEAASADAAQRVVRIAATADVTINEEHGEGDALGLVCHVNRVAEPALARTVASASARSGMGGILERKRYLHAQRIGGISHRSELHSLLAMTGTDGVTVRESVTGAAVRIAARDPEVGARFAYQIVTPDEKREINGKTEIRVLTGPGVNVEIIEAGLRPPMGPTPDSLGASNVELVLYETDNPALVPPQGAPLERELMESVGAARVASRRSSMRSPRPGRAWPWRWLTRRRA